MFSTSSKIINASNIFINVIECVFLAYMIFYKSAFKMLSIFSIYCVIFLTFFKLQYSPRLETPCFLYFILVLLMTVLLFKKMRVLCFKYVHMLVQHCLYIQLVKYIFGLCVVWQSIFTQYFIFLP